MDARSLDIHAPTANAAASPLLLPWEVQCDGAAIFISKADVLAYATNHDHYLSYALQDALSNGMIKPGTQIQLASDAIYLMDMYAFQKYLHLEGMPLDVEIKIVSDDSSPRLAMQDDLEKEFEYSQSYHRLVAYMQDPKADTNVVLSDAMRKKYDDNHGDFIDALIVLIAEGKIAPRTKIDFRPNSLMDFTEARRFVDVLVKAKLPVGVDMVYPRFSKDGNIAGVRDMLKNLMDKKKQQDANVAFAVLMSKGMLDASYKEDGAVMVVPVKPAYECIYRHLNLGNDNTYHKAASLQHDRVQQRTTASRHWAFFKFGSALAGAVVLAVGVVVAAKNLK